MAAAQNPYSRFVAWSKVVLPIMALALLSTLFLFSGKRNSTLEIPYSDVEIEELSRGEQIGAPRYSGVTRDGAAMRITAATLAPATHNPKLLQARTVTARIDTPDGQGLDVSSTTGAIDTGDGLARLSGDVTFVTTTGYQMETETMFADLDNTRVESAGAVEGDGPPGHLTAGKMILTPREGETGRYVLVFNEGVKLIYRPVD